jgi:transcriptional regulator with XRE-family HTH domain
MRNDRLRDAMQSSGLTAIELAEGLGVDPKTVERWITQGREPYRRHRQRIAIRLGERESYLWPSVDTGPKAKRRQGPASESEVIRLYPHRSMIPSDLWDRLFDQAISQIDILVYVGMFMTERPNLLADMKHKAGAGVQVRILFGRRDSAAVIQRSTDEGIGPRTISAKIDHVLAHFAPLMNTAGIDIRLHETVLYNSIYRFDDEMIVNPHVYGKIASHAPALHLKKLSNDSGDLFNMYAESFDAVWDGATPYA